MRVVLAGQRSFGAATLRTVSRVADVVLVCAPADDPLAAAAELERIPVVDGLQAAGIPDDVDVIVAAHSHAYIGRPTRNRARLGAIGYHPSLLPLHRGRDAVRWTVRMGDRVAGGSVYWLSDNVDAGDLAAQDWCFVRPDDTASSLWRRDLFPMGLRLLGRVLEDLGRGHLVRVPQDESLATWEPSWDRAPLPRPELTMIGNGHGLVARVDPLELRR